MLGGGKQAFLVTGLVRQSGCPWAGKRGVHRPEREAVGPPGRRDTGGGGKGGVEPGVRAPPVSPA